MLTVAEIAIKSTVTLICGGRRGSDRMVVRFITTYAISAYHHLHCEFESRSTLCDKVCQ